MRKIRIYLPILLVLICVSLLTKNAFSDAVLLDVEYNQLTKESKKQVDCLAENIYHEAGYEPAEGKKAVALVTLNRTQDPRFPKDICGVVKQKTNIAEKIVCQFSWFCQRPKLNRNDAYKESLDIALFVYANYENLKDITNGALYYHADYVNPRWKLEKTTVIGRHIFYKESGKYYDAKNESSTEGRAVKTLFSTSNGRDFTY